MNSSESVYFMKSERIGFKTWDEESIFHALDLWGDIQVTRFIGGPFDEEYINTRLRNEINIQNTHNIQYWPIFLKENNEFVGCCGVRPYNNKTTTLEIGFHIKASAWGKGIASEAAKRVIRHAFDDLHVERIFAGHNPNNSASKVLLEKLGFQFSHDEFYEPTGLNHPSYFLIAPTGVVATTSLVS
jgi:ribosomal-protein-alanine N-acetyltransferase